MNNTLRLTALSAALLALAACGQTTVDASLSSRSGNLSVAMTDSSTAGAKAQSIEVTGRPPAGRVTSLILNLAGAQAVAGAGKPVTVTLSASLPDSDSDGNPDVDLIALAGGELTLTDSPLPAGTYRQFRLTTVRDGVYAVLEDGSKWPVAVPGGAQSGLKIVMKHGFTVGESTGTSFTLDFDLARSLHATGTGMLVLKPV
ncbi:MAG TPA: DUF4382 domain-containing protein, partial [Deinococcales bacterium]|nr:DUF4382 domain-containing protein [Deinococcales bacterium]